MKKKILFIDWHETISKDRFFSSLHKSKIKSFQLIGKEIDKLLFSDDQTILYEWMRGKLTSEEVIEFVSNQLLVDPKWLWEIFENDCKSMSIPNKVHDKLNLLKENYFLVLITGNMDCFNRFTVPAQNLNTLFHQIVNSSDLGYLKDEFNGLAFKKIIHAKQTSSFHCYLIDDNKNACKVFQNIGGASLNLKLSNSKLLCKKLDELIYLGPNLMLPF